MLFEWDRKNLVKTTKQGYIFFRLQIQRWSQSRRFQVSVSFLHRDLQHWGFATPRVKNPYENPLYSVSHKMDVDSPSDIPSIVPDATGQKYGKILCCECGLPIDPNPANMCVTCIRGRVDITSGMWSLLSSVCFGTWWLSTLCWTFEARRWLWFSIFCCLLKYE